MNLLARTVVAIAAGAVLAATAADAQDKYSLESPSGIAFADFKGYEEIGRAHV